MVWTIKKRVMRKRKGTHVDQFLSISQGKFTANLVHDFLLLAALCQCYYISLFLSFEFVIANVPCHRQSCIQKNSRSFCSFNITRKYEKQVDEKNKGRRTRAPQRAVISSFLAWLMEFNYDKDERVLCYHGPLLYEAKVRALELVYSSCYSDRIIKDYKTRNAARG